MLPGMGGNPRQLARMMKSMGIDVKEISDVEEVVIRTPDKEYVFRDAAVSVMKAQGTTTYQVVGSPTVRSRGGSDRPTGKAVPPAPAPSEEVRLEIAEEDVALVAEQTGRSRDEARRALEETNGDIAEAIVRLS